MKIVRLGLNAFGPFSGRQLDLSTGRQGLHLIFGANEAGKSSALRALRQALFGIPVRSEDDFLHPYAKLRIALELEHSDGTRLNFIRRKGRINTLRDGDDQDVIEAGGLDRFLSGMGPDLFNAMFAMDHGGLVQGGREIVRGQGDLGQILFAAGSGIADLHQVRGDLKAEADWANEVLLPEPVDRVYVNGPSYIRGAQPLEITFRQRMEPKE